MMIFESLEEAVDLFLNCLIDIPGFYCNQVVARFCGAFHSRTAI